MINPLKVIQIGTAKSEPGKVTYGFIDGINLPTGETHKIPVMIAQGKEDGPTFFLTANIHGSELTGIAVIHELVTDRLVQELKGTVVAIPTLNPYGLRNLTRSPEIDDRDPNRLFPEGRFTKKDEKEDEDHKYPKPFEQVANKIYSYFEKYADFHIDFHNHAIQSVPYSIIDRVFYKNETEKEEVTQLLEKQKAMVEAFGVLVCVEFPPKKYLKKKLYRSASGCTFNNLRIPAFTAELGGNTIIFPHIVAGSIKGTRNVLKWAGMLEGPLEEITEFSVLKPSERIRRAEHPRTKESGIIKFLVEPGAQVTKGQPIAQILDVFGRPLGDGIIRTEFDGYIIALKSGMTVYANEAFVEMGIKDDAPLVAPIPSEKD